MYVKALARELCPLGWTSTIVAPGDRDFEFSSDGQTIARVHHIAPKDAAYGAPDERLAEHFDRLLERIAPDIVHLHAWSSAVSERLLTFARRRGIRTVVTYHTPTMSCPRGTMLLFGQTPCDGRLDVTRCTICTLRSHNVPAGFAWLLGHTPITLGSMAARASLRRGPWLALRMRGLVAARITRFNRFILAADHVVAVCSWVANVIRINGIDPNCVTLSRQGLAHRQAKPTARDRQRDEGSLRIGYFGRLDSTKGIDTLIEAVRSVAAQVDLIVYGVNQSGSAKWVQHLISAAGSDPRIQFATALEPEQVHDAMSTMDIIAIPSIGLETGPLVVLEAFSAGRPVLASDRGGIAELVRNGIDGVLVAAGDVAAWGEAIERLARDRRAVVAMARNIRPVRTMREVASEMNELYRSLLGEKALA